jgi:hypothetical protein
MLGVRADPPLPLPESSSFQQGRGKQQQSDSISGVSRAAGFHHLDGV